MLYVTVGSVRAGTRRERTARRLQWSYPPGMKLVGEYWLQADDPSVIIITETEDAGPMMAALADWDDLLSWTVYPAVSAEQGMELAKRMMA